MDDKKYYVVYQITNRLNGRIYIGVHMTRNLEDRYLGSGVEIKRDLKKLGRKCFEKKNLFVFNSREEMLAKERELVTKEFCMRVDTYNMIEGGGTYTKEGKIAVKDNDGNRFLVYVDDPRYLSGELVHTSTGISCNKGMINVRDKEGNVFQVSKNDTRYQSGELVFWMKGQPQQNNFSWLGRTHSQETKEKIGKINSEYQRGERNSQFGTCWITNNSENKKIKLEHLEEWIKLGWVKGRK